MDVIKLELRSGDRTVTPEQMLASMARDPQQAAKIARGGIAVQAQPADLKWLRTTAIGQYIEPDGEITSAFTGAEEIIAAQIVAACVGFLVGLGAGIALGDGDSGTGTETEGEEEGGEDPGGEGGVDPE